MIEPCAVCPSRNQHGECNFMEEFIPLLAKDFAMQEQYTRLVNVGHSTIVYKMYASLFSRGNQIMSPHKQTISSELSEIDEVIIHIGSNDVSKRSEARKNHRECAFCLQATEGN